MLVQETLVDVVTGLPVQAGGVMALGNFDGVHMGHQAVLKEAAAKAESLGVPALALTFEPHPYSLFQKEKTPFLLMRPEEKRAALCQAGAAAVVSLPFTPGFASLSPEEFVDQILIQGCAVKHVVVGYDFAFGAHRGGDRELLRSRLIPKGVGVTEVPPLKDIDGDILSSTRIRVALRAGDIGKATRMLGQPFKIKGIIEKGDQRGRLLGFPTANISMGEYVRPLFGVYAVKAGPTGQERCYPGVANIGNRPTVDGVKELLEVHLFDFDGDLYGQEWEIELHAYIRAEKKFPNLEELKAQIQQDSLAARRFLSA